MKNVAILLLAVLVLCGSGLAEAKVINIASVFPPGAPAHEGLEKFKELVEAESNGKLKVLIHASGAMGGEREVVEGLSAGTIEIGAQGVMDFVYLKPEYFTCEVPYVLRGIDHFWKLWKGPVGQELMKEMEDEFGIMTVGIVLRGARYLTANKPIETPEDVKGLRLRLPQVTAWTKIWESLEAVPTVVAFPEVYMALKTGVVEAQENPPETIYTYKFYEAQKYLIATKHIISRCAYQISKKWFDQQSEEDQKLILKAFTEATEYANSLAKDVDAKFVALLQEKGMVLIEPDVALFQKAAEGGFNWCKDNLWAPGALERITSIE